MEVLLSFYERQDLSKARNVSNKTCDHRSQQSNPTCQKRSFDYFTMHELFMPKYLQVQLIIFQVFFFSNINEELQLSRVIIVSEKCQVIAPRQRGTTKQTMEINPKHIQHCLSLLSTSWILRQNISIEKTSVQCVHSLVCANAALFRAANPQ